ncbi:MAG: hypothetical protein HQL06_17475 [Nitrospirae bacterium]|nr:hypothetical protein [Nitrospirota bacterium]
MESCTNVAVAYGGLLFFCCGKSYSHGKEGVVVCGLTIHGDDCALGIAGHGIDKLATVGLQ